MAGYGLAGRRGERELSSRRKIQGVIKCPFFVALPDSK